MRRWRLHVRVAKVFVLRDVKDAIVLLGTQEELVVVPKHPTTRLHEAKSGESA